MGAMGNTYTILTGKPEGKILSERSMCRQEHDIKMDLRKIGWKGVDLIHLAQDRERWRVLVNKGIEHFGVIRVGEVS
jgi:hypothetical protein